MVRNDFINERVKTTELVFDIIKRNKSIWSSTLYSIVKNQNKDIHNQAIRKSIIILRHLKLIDTINIEGKITLIKDCDNLRPHIEEYFQGYTGGARNRSMDNQSANRIRMIENLKAKLIVNTNENEKTLLRKVINIYEANLANGVWRIDWNLYKKELLELLKQVEIKSQKDLYKFFEYIPNFALSILPRRTVSNLPISSTSSVFLTPVSDSGSYKICKVTGLTKNGELQLVFDEQGKLYGVSELHGKK